MQRGAFYSIVFAGLVCLVCAVVVSSSAVTLRERQETNAFLDKQRNVLVAAGLATEDEELSREEIERRFEPIQTVVVDLRSGAELPDVDPGTFDQRAATSDPSQSRVAPENRAGIQRVPEQALVYRLEEDGRLSLLILPVEGKGLWSTLYGFLALDSDLRTVRGITFYEHKETPGLGGEVDNPRWKALWPGRIALDENLDPKLEVIRGQAGSPEEDPHRVDGLAGATMTSRGVSYLVQFWLDEGGFRPYLEAIREQAQTGGEG
jgi:Na+-transporting NADH:ubiquinone oxidoreductase subunit C